MSKEKKNKVYGVYKLTKEDIEAMDRAGRNTAVLEKDDVYFLAKEKEDENGSKYLKPFVDEGRLYVTAVEKAEAKGKFEKAVAAFASACVAAGTFASLEIADKVAKPAMNDFFKRRKLDADFSKVEDFRCVLPDRSNVNNIISDTMEDIMKKADKIVKLGKACYKDLENEMYTEFAVFDVDGDGLSTESMKDAFASYKNRKNQEGEEDRDMVNVPMPQLDNEEYDTEEEECDKEEEEEEAFEL